MRQRRPLTPRTSQTPQTQSAWPIAALCGLLGLLAGCAQPGPTAPEPRRLDAAALQLAPASLTAGAATAPAIAADWWRGWGDATLARLVDQALADQPDLQAAATRVARAQAAVRAAASTTAPQVQAGADLTAQRFTEVGLVPKPIAGSTRETANVQLGIGWSPDWSGRLAAEWQAALGQQRAQALSLAAARQALASQVVQAYVQLARLQAQRGLLLQQQGLRQQALALVRQRQQAGLDTVADLRQAEAPVPEAGQQLAALDEQVTLARHALALLCGQGPGALADLQAPLDALQPQALPAHLGADLLGRRADVQAALWRVEAARQDLAAARAQYYPDVNLSGFIGFNALGLNHLLDLGARNLAAGPALRLPLFDGGRLDAQQQARNADRDLAIAQYNRSVLDAVREAADALASLAGLTAQQSQQRATEAALASARDLARQRHAAGLGNRLPVLAAEAALLAQRRNALDLQARRLQLQAALVQALGGGWTDAMNKAPDRVADPGPHLGPDERPPAGPAVAAAQPMQ